MDNILAEQFKQLTNLTEVTYYYHVTNNNPEDILNDGLYMVGSNIYETAIEIPEEFRENPAQYALGERGNLGYRENASIIIIGIFEDKQDELIKPATIIPSGWNADELPNYYIPKENILAYIDTNTLELIVNDNADIDYCYHL